MNKRLVIGLVCVVLAILAAGVALYHREQAKQRTVRGSSTIEFLPSQAPGEKKRPRRLVNEIPWPMYGYDAERSHVAADFRHRPPFRQLWAVETGWFIEFPPAIGDGRAYVGNLRGRFLAIRVSTGKVDWQKRFGGCVAAGPAVKGRIVVISVANPSCGKDSDRTSQPGSVVAMDAYTGRELWVRRMGVTESSPLIVGRLVYVGSWDHHMYALDLRTGNVRWSYDTGEEIDSSAAYAGGIVYIGANEGHVYAFGARSGRLIWRAGGGREYFYATPTVAYGRVYIGNTDGTLYAYGAKTGDLLWAHPAGTYIYSAAAVWRHRVYVGTYDGFFRAFDAATGDPVWSWEAPAKVHGAPTVMAGLVYFSTATTGPYAHPSRYVKRGPRGTYALNARTGKLVWKDPGVGQYSPVVADQDRVYRIGATRVYAFESRRESKRSQAR